jgi:hypothetical protein
MARAPERPAAAAGPRQAWGAAGTPRRRMRGGREPGAARSRLPPREKDRAGRDADGSAAGAVTKAMCARGISRPSRRLKHRSDTLADAFFPGGEDAPPRVQVVAEPGKMRVSVRWRWDLNPSAGEISPVTDMNTKTSEKSPVWGSHVSTIAGATRPASSGFRRLRSQGAARLRCPRVRRARGSGLSSPVSCLVLQGDGPYPGNRIT